MLGHELVFNFMCSNTLWVGLAFNVFMVLYALAFTFKVVYGTLLVGLYFNMLYRTLYVALLLKFCTVSNGLAFTFNVVCSILGVDI